MSVIADLSIPTDQFALAATLEALPAARVEFERVVTHSQEWVMPFLWVTGCDLDEFDREIRQDPTVDEAEVADQFEGVCLYQIKWAPPVRELVNTIFDQSGVLIEARGDANMWDVLVQFDSRHSLAELEEYFEQGRSAFTLTRLYEPDAPRHLEYNLTETQREALVTAVGRGFFDVPRRTTLDELADDLDASSSAVSERLRRAVATLTRTALSNEDDDTARDR